MTEEQTWGKRTRTDCLQRILRFDQKYLDMNAKFSMVFIICVCRYATFGTRCSAGVALLGIEVLTSAAYSVEMYTSASG